MIIKVKLNTSTTAASTIASEPNPISSRTAWMSLVRRDMRSPVLLF
jgi:hypothetical protein